MDEDFKGIVDFNYHTMMNEFVNKITKSYDNFLLECLKPYGVTMTNVVYYARRIEVVSTPNVKEFYLDGIYIFSIEEMWEFKDGPGNTFGFKETYRKFVKEDSDE